MTIDTMTALLRELSPAAQNRIFKMILAEAQDYCAADVVRSGPRELWLETIDAAAGAWLQCIKAVRAITGLPLREAKDLCDTVMEGSPQSLRVFENHAAALAAAQEFKGTAATQSIRVVS